MGSASVTSEPPRKPQWFPPVRPLPDPRNLPARPVIKPAPTPKPEPKQSIWRLPWPPSESAFFTRAGHLSSLGEGYISVCAAVVRRSMVEYAVPVRLCVIYWPPAGVTLLDPYIVPVRHALRACGVWAAPELVREQRFAFASPVNRNRGPVRVTVAPL